MPNFMLLTEGEQFKHIYICSTMKGIFGKIKFLTLYFHAIFFCAEGLGEGGALWKIPVKNTADRFLC